jgi:Tfp pilus assembly protein PilF
MNPPLPHPRARAAAPLRAISLTLSLALLLAGCGAPKPPPSGLAELLERPAERALVEGLRAYDEGQYTQAEAALQRALGAGLASGRDRASAHKLLAFIACTSERVPECEAAFRAARAADPAFALNRSEAGHPLWGPVYRRVLGTP